MDAETQKYNDSLALEYETMRKREEDLIKERQETMDGSAAVVQRFKEMRRRAYNNKKFTDPKTFADTEKEVAWHESEIKRINVEIMMVQRKLGDLRRLHARNIQTINKADPSRREKYGVFHEVAQEILPEETFLKIWNIVEGRMKPAEEEGNSDLA